MAKKGAAAFFPNGKSEFGYLSSFNIDGLGTYQGIIPQQGFDLELLVDANGGASKTKIYIYLTKKKKVSIIKGNKIHFS